MIEINFCLECHNKLNLRSRKACNLYTIIVAHYVNTKNSFIYNPKKNRVYKRIRFLEKNRYIVTTEIGKNKLQIKPNGLTFLDVGHISCFICFKNFCHD